MRWSMNVILLALPAAAQDDPGGSFFKKSDIDFWGSATRRSPPHKDLRESIFAEPVRMPDGRYAVYVPPPEVLAFLEEPTKEKARAYLEWQNARSKKIAATLEALEAVKREESPPRDDPTVHLTYFRQSG